MNLTKANFGAWFLVGLLTITAFISGYYKGVMAFIDEEYLDH